MTDLEPAAPPDPPDPPADPPDPPPDPPPAPPAEGAVAPGTAVRGALGLAVCGGSLALAFEQLAGSWVPAFVTANVVSQRARNVLLIVMAVGALLGAGAALALVRFGRGRGVARLSLVARLAAPLALAALVPGLLSIDPWGDTLILGLSLAVFVAVAEPLFRLSFAAWAEAAAVPARASASEPGAALAHWRAWVRAAQAMIDRLPAVVRRHGPAIAVAAAVVLYAAYMGYFTVLSHHKFNTYNWDLGHYDNEAWNDLHGRPFRNTLLFREGNWANLRNHVQPTIFALLPFYALYPHAETLLLLQAFIIAAGAIPLYRFGARRLPRALAATLAIAYLLYPPTHGLQFFDFHFQPIAAACLLAAWDALDERRMRRFWLFFVLAIGCREDVSAGTAVLGMALLLGSQDARRARQGAAIFVISAAYFVAFRFFIMPMVGAWGFADLYKQLFPEGEGNFVGIVRTLLTNPLFVLRTLLTSEKLRYALQIVAPLAFLPLRRPYLALSLLPGGFFTLLTTQYGPTLEINFQYSGAFVGYIFPAAALALACLGKDRGGGEGPRGVVRRRAAAATLIAATLIATAQWGAFPPRAKFRSGYGWISFEPVTDEERQRLRDLEEMDRMVPKTASLAASDREIPHVSNRYECWNLAAGYTGADYVLFTSVRPIQPDLEQAAAAEHAGYVRAAVRPGLVLLKRPGAP